MPLIPRADSPVTQGKEKNANLTKSKEQRMAARKRRRNELAIAGAFFVVMVALILIQLQYFDSSSIIFFALFNLNAILLLGVLFVVLRNLLKLILERRRRIIGSRLRTRLVLVITGMIIGPCLIMFLVSAQFVKLSVDFWFKNQIETTMDTALSIASSLYETTGQRLRSQAEYTLKELDDRGYSWSGANMDALLERKRQEYRLALTGVLDADLRERNWHPLPRVGTSWQTAKEQLDWDAIRHEGFRFVLVSGSSSDFIYGVLAVDGGNKGYLVLSEDMGMGFRNRLDHLSGGAEEYKKLRNLKYPMKLMLYVTLTVLTSLIALGAIWFAFKVSRELISPIMALVGATERIAKGDLNVRIQDSSTDELGILVQAFNRMAGELGESRTQLTETNDLLAQQNLVLDQQRRYVETVLDNIAAGVLSFGLGWVITTANKAACEILGYEREELRGRRITELLPDSQMDLARETARRLTEHPYMQLQQQFRLPKDSSERHLLVTSVGLPGPDGQLQGAVVVFEDVTEMEKMQRMSAWREVARRIAHEIKNPLTPIKLSAQRLEKKFGPDIEDAAFHQSTQLIVRQVEQLQTMVQEFSAFAKMPEIRPVRGRLEPLLEEVVNMFRNSHSGINWFLDMEELPKVEMDEAALQRVFINILTNAVEALAGRKNAAVSVKAAVRKKLNLVRIDFADNGEEDLTDDELGRLFEPYFSHKKGGTGLGLTIVRSIVSEHHGYVRASRRKGGGTVITVELPLL